MTDTEKPGMPRLATITHAQSRDAGMAAVLLLLLAFTAYRHNWLLATAIILHVVNMTAPAVFKPFAVLWFGFSQLLGAVMSKVILSAVFFVVVTPIGLIRRALGSDAMAVRRFKVGKDSVMVDRHHRFTASDIVKPY